MGTLSKNIVKEIAAPANDNGREERKRAILRAQDMLFDDPTVPQHCHMLERIPPEV